jgi:hypothetical protein
LAGRLFFPVSVVIPPETLKLPLQTVLSHNRDRLILRAARETEQTPKESVGTLSAGITGENSPYYTNPPRKMKTDRVLMTYFLPYYSRI